MKRLVLSAILIVPLLLPASCGKEPLKQAGLQGESTLGVVRDLTSAYERRDIEAFMDKISSAYPDREGFRKTVENVFGTYQTIMQNVQYSRIVVTVQEKGHIRAAFTWEGEWRTVGGKIVKDGARSTLVLDRGMFKLLSIEGKNPYVPVETPMPVRQ
jgi:hypothetical protein